MYANIFLYFFNVLDKKYFIARRFRHFSLQWGLEYQTRLDFGWYKVVQMLNGSVFDWFLYDPQVEGITQLFVAAELIPHCR